MSDESQALRVLAGLYGVEPQYFDISGRQRVASPEALVAVLRSLGASLDSPEDAAAAVAARRAQLARRILEPVIVAWDGRGSDLDLRLPATHQSGHAELTLHLEDGRTRSARVDLRPGKTFESEGEWLLRRAFRLPDDLEPGYHTLVVESRSVRAEALVISAPSRAYGADEDAREWGMFLPLYALQGDADDPIGDYGDLQRLMEWLDSRGGSVVATLPLMASFHDYPADASPYAPVSRLFWNELYVDVEAAPEYNRSHAARTIVESPAYRAEAVAIAREPLVDHVRIMNLKRPVLEALAAAASNDDLADFVSRYPRALDYARFRAACERHGRPWSNWSHDARNGDIADVDGSSVRYHLYVQRLATQQIDAIAERARSRGQELYLDLPLGVNADGYDAWRERTSFAEGVAAGAPPDDFFTGGQNWGFAPLHPERIRADRYRYVREYLRAQIQRASLLRLDHVMGLHRLFWVPQGFEAVDGVYVRYNADEMYAILLLESQRARTRLVGENLGTVPPYVNETMERHGLLTMYVAQFEAGANDERPMREPPARCVASLNTHDVPPFASYWHERDLQTRLNLGFQVESAAEGEREQRRAVRDALGTYLRREGLAGDEAPAARAILMGWLSFLAASPARLVLVNAEDLWLEDEQQNVPGTVDQHPNWQRRARLPMSEFTQAPEVADVLARVNELRKQKHG